jgi:hypothetical protein
MERQDIENGGDIEAFERDHPRNHETDDQDILEGDIQRRHVDLLRREEELRRREDEFRRLI